MNRFTRRLAPLGVTLALLVIAFALELLIPASQTSPTLAIGSPYLAGFYDLEQTATLPGAGGPLRREYRWMAEQGWIRLAPPAAGDGQLTLEYLTPDGGGAVRVARGDEQLIELPASPVARSVSLFVPASAIAELSFTQLEPVEANGRQLGMLLSASHWQPGGGAVARSASQLPLTIGLWLLVLAAADALSVAGILATIGLLAGGGLTKWLRPWEWSAAQPVLQGLLIAGLLGALAWRLLWRPISRWGWLLLGVWALSWLFFFHPNVSHDGTEYYAYVRSLLIDGDLDFSNELDPAQSPFSGTPNLAAFPTVTGRTPNLASVGPALVWTPFWLIGHVVTKIGAAAGMNWVADGYAPPYIICVTLASALAGLFTLFGCWTLARRWFTPGIAALAAATAYIGGNLLFYATLEGSFAHSLSAASATWFAVSIFAANERPEWRRWAAVGLSGGLMIVTYWITALLLIMPALVWLRWAIAFARSRDRAGLVRLITGAAVAAGAALAIFVPQMIAWKIIYGGWLATPHGGDYITPGNMHLKEVMVAAMYGMAWWTPAFFIGLAGSLWFARRHPWSGAVLLAGGLVYILYNASLTRWFAGGSFGLRRFGVLAPLYTVGLASIFSGLRGRRGGLAVAAAGAICAWSVAMTVRYASFAVSHDTDILGKTDLRAIVLPPDPFPLDKLAAIAGDSWPLSLARSLSVGNMLLAICCGGLIAATAAVLLRRTDWGPAVQQLRVSEKKRI